MNARSTPISRSPLPRRRRRAAQGSPPARHVGDARWRAGPQTLDDAPVIIISEGRAFRVETEISCPPSRRPDRGRRSPPPRLSAPLSEDRRLNPAPSSGPGNQPDPAALAERIAIRGSRSRRFIGDRPRRARPRHRAGKATPPQNRADDLDRRDFADDRWGAYRHRLWADAGARYEPDYGLTRLETVRVSRAAADQRRGRASHTEPGVCYRLWEAAASGALEAFAPPEIVAADLSGLVLDLAAWGVRDPLSLKWLDPPPPPALKEARALLCEIGAIDADGALTARGASIARLALPPRLGKMIVGGG